MALELLAGPFNTFPVVDRRRAMGLVPDGYPELLSGNGSMLIDGRGILTQYGAGQRGRYLLQHDGAHAPIGASRLRSYGAYTLVCEEGGARWYAEMEFLSTDEDLRTYALDPLTLAGFRDIGPGCPNGDRQAVRLPDGVTWLRVNGTRIERHTGIAWVQEATVPIRSGTYLSWGDGAEEFWIGNSEGELVMYNWRTRKVSPVSRTGMGGAIWYSRKHRVFLSLSTTQLDPDDWRTIISQVRVWATTPRPTALVQTVTPTPAAGRVSRVTTRVVGSFNEPCAGEVVRWTGIRGCQPVPRAPITDADGYAHADLIVPMGMNDVGGVTAEVVV